MIDGTPESTLVPKRINFANGPFAEYSARYIPPPTPTGIAINDAIDVTIIVPKIAFPIPPPSRPGGGGS